MTQHPYAEILRAIADGKEIEWLDCDGVWSSQEANEALSEIADTLLAPESYRVKPETININGIEVPKPLAELQEETLFWPSFTHTRPMKTGLRKNFATGLNCSKPQRFTLRL